MSRLSHQTGGSSELGPQEFVRNGLAEVKQSNAALGEEGSAGSASQLPDGELGLCPRRSGVPGTREGERMKGPTLSPSSRGAAHRQVPSRGSKGARIARRFLGEGPRPAARDTAPSPRPTVLAPALARSAIPGLRGGRPGGRERRGEARPLPPLSGSSREPSSRSPAVPNWRPGLQSGWRATRGLGGHSGTAREASAAAAAAAVAAAARQRTRLSGARGLHCSPRRRHRAALHAQPRAAWSHALPAPRALGPAPPPRPAAPQDSRGLSPVTRSACSLLRPAVLDRRSPKDTLGVPRNPEPAPIKGVGLITALTTTPGDDRREAEHVASQVTVVGSWRSAPCLG